MLLGRPSLRTNGEWRELEPGDALSFPLGREGGHQVANWADVTARFLAISTSGTPDLVVYPDSRKLGACERLPDRTASGRSSASRRRRLPRRRAPAHRAAVGRPSGTCGECHLASAHTRGPDPQRAGLTPVMRTWHRMNHPLNDADLRVQRVVGIDAGHSERSRITRIPDTQTRSSAAHHQGQARNGRGQARPLRARPRFVAKWHTRAPLWRTCASAKPSRLPSSHATSPTSSRLRSPSPPLLSACPRARGRLSGGIGAIVLTGACAARSDLRTSSPSGLSLRCSSGRRIRIRRGSLAAVALVGLLDLRAAAACASARGRRAADGIVAARDGRCGDGPDRQRAALVRPAAALERHRAGWVVMVRRRCPSPPPTRSPPSRPHARRWFARRFGAPTPAQGAGWPRSPRRARCSSPRHRLGQDARRVPAVPRPLVRRSRRPQPAARICSTSRHSRRSPTTSSATCARHSPGSARRPRPRACELPGSASPCAPATPRPTSAAACCARRPTSSSPRPSSLYLLLTSRSREILAQRRDGDRRRGPRRGRHEARRPPGALARAPRRPLPARPAAHRASRRRSDRSRRSRASSAAIAAGARSSTPACAKELELRSWCPSRTWPARATDAPTAPSVPAPAT